MCEKSGLRIRIEKARSQKQLRADLKAQNVTLKNLKELFGEKPKQEQLELRLGPEQLALPFLV